METSPEPVQLSVIKEVEHRSVAVLDRGKVEDEEALFLGLVGEPVVLLGRTRKEGKRLAAEGGQ